MSISSKMTAIADGIRTLQGGTDKLGLDAMAAQVGAANSTVTVQASLIASIQAALEGKAAGGEAAGGGLTQYANGALAAPSSSQNTLTVSGLAFRPKVAFFVFMKGTYSQAGFGSELVAYCEAEGAAVSATFTPADDGFTFSGQYVRRTGAKTIWYALG